MTKMYWIQTPIPDRLGTMARARGGDWLEADIQHLRQGNVDIFVSLLTAATVLTTYGIAVEEAFSLIEQCRGLAVPDTQEQRKWVT